MSEYNDAEKLLSDLLSSIAGYKHEIEEEIFSKFSSNKNEHEKMDQSHQT